MPYSKQEWLQTIFEKADQGDLETESLELALKNVYWAVDGVRTIGEIAEENMYAPEELISLINVLSEKGLVTPKKPQGMVEDATFHLILTLLSDQLGPMGEIVLQDAVKSLGHQVSSFPKERMPKLIETLSKEMGDSGNVKHFQQTVLEQINPKAGSSSD